MCTALLALLLSTAAGAVDLPTTEEAAAVARLQAIRAYKARRLQVRAYTDLSGGGSSMSPSMGLGGYQIMSDPIRTTHTWGLFQGPTRLTMPEFYRVTGSSDKEADLQRRITTNRQISMGMYGLGVLGVSAAAIGLVGGLRNNGFSDRHVNTMLVGAVTAAVGFSVAGIPAGKADRLEHDPTHSLMPLEAQTLVDSYNERLRMELGVSALDAASLELGEAAATGSQ